MQKRKREYCFQSNRSFKITLVTSFLAELSSSPPGPYHQDPYICKPEERIKSPPILPPHLLQVILNKDTGISVSREKVFRKRQGTPVKSSLDKVVVVYSREWVALVRKLRAKKPLVKCENLNFGLDHKVSPQHNAWLSCLLFCHLCS